MSLQEILGYLTAILVIASYVVTSPVWLRWLGGAAGVVLAIYALIVGHWGLLAIAVILVAVNAWRLIEMQRLVARVHEASAGSAAPVSLEWLLPYMRPLALPKDHIVFHKGDVANGVYFISSGRVGFEEIGIDIGPGNLFGEIGALSVDQIRTATAKCLQASSLLYIDGENLRELYYKNPDFGFAIVGLITRRLMADLDAARRKA